MGSKASKPLVLSELLTGQRVYLQDRYLVPIGPATLVHCEVSGRGTLSRQCSSHSVWTSEIALWGSATRLSARQISDSNWSCYSRTLRGECGRQELLCGEVQRVYLQDRYLIPIGLAILVHCEESGRGTLSRQCSSHSVWTSGIALWGSATCLSARQISDSNWSCYSRTLRGVCGRQKLLCGEVQRVYLQDRYLIPIGLAVLVHCEVVSGSTNLIFPEQMFDSIHVSHEEVHLVDNVLHTLCGRQELLCGEVQRVYLQDRYLIPIGLPILVHCEVVSGSTNLIFSVDWQMFDSVHVRLVDDTIDDDVSSLQGRDTGIVVCCTVCRDTPNGSLLFVAACDIMALQSC
ncbi:hypothetical protein TNCV_1440851 [Trichonephila clavipes]|nr:hypothetical protein TNCV_1440851 [Trichonephila clavipes]